MSNSQRFCTVVLSDQQSASYSSASRTLPARSRAMETLVNIPAPVSADGFCAAAQIAVPAGGIAVAVDYVELTVANQDGTQVLSVGTFDTIIVQPGTSHIFDAAELNQVLQQTGSDLTLGSDGSISSTAGGVFSSQLYIRLA